MSEAVVAEGLRGADRAERRPRIPAFDLLRGFFVFVIVTNHLRLEPNLFELVTGRAALPASAAEGFYALSGIMVGYVYLPMAVRGGIGGVARRIWRRAALIYVTAVALVMMRLVLLAIDGVAIDAVDLRDVLLLGGANGVLADFLAIYAIAMLFAPIAIWLAVRRLEWIVVVVAAVPWLFAQFAPGLDSDLEMKLSWPLLFMIGIVIGCRWPALASGWRRFAPTTRRGIETALIVVLLVTVPIWEFLIFWNHHVLVAFATRGPSDLIAALFWIEGHFLEFWSWFGPLQSKATLAPARLLFGVVWFAGLLALMRRHGSSIDRALGGLLSAYGRNSLAAYTIHAVVISCVLQPVLLVVREVDDLMLNTLVVVAVQVIVILLVRGWVATKAAFRGRRLAGSS